MEYTVEDSVVSDFVGKKQRKKAEEMYCSQLAIWRIRALLRGGVLHGYMAIFLLLTRTEYGMESEPVFPSRASE